MDHGFSEGQLKGIDLDAIAKAFGQESRQANLPESKGNGMQTPKEFTQEISAAEKSTALLPDFDIRDELDPASVKLNGHHDLHTSAVAASLSARGDGVLPIAIIGMSCHFPGGASNVEKFQTLVSEGRSAWSKIPESRFNVDAFYHPDSDRIDSVSYRALFESSWRKNG